MEKKAAPHKRGIPVYNPELSGDGIVCHNIEFIEDDTMKWAETEHDALEKERAAKGTDYTSASKLLPKGENEIEILNKQPLKISGSFGEQAVLPVKVDGSDFKMTVKINSPLYKDIVRVCSATDDEWVKVKILRTGEGKQTRYDLL